MLLVDISKWEKDEKTQYNIKAKTTVQKYVWINFRCISIVIIIDGCSIKIENERVTEECV